jgi:hypothetical protein
MLPIHTILYPTDFSAASAEAFRLACALAHDYRAHLIIQTQVGSSVRPYTHLRRRSQTFTACVNRT